MTGKAGHAGGRGDAGFIEFTESLKTLHAENAIARAASERETTTLDEFLAEAERRWWADRDPATATACLLAEARRRLRLRGSVEELNIASDP